MMQLEEIKKSEHRGKLVETFWLFWSYLLMGFDNGMIGPCVPDLRRIVGVSLRKMSYVFLLQGLGALVGNLLALIPERWFDRRLLVGVYVLLGSVVNILLPLYHNFYYLLIFCLFQGVTKGLTDYAAISLCNALWEKDKVLPFQFIIVGIGIGTFVSPFLAQPFIKATPIYNPSSSISSGSCHSGTAGNPVLMGWSNTSTHDLSLTMTNSSAHLLSVDGSSAHPESLAVANTSMQGISLSVANDSTHSVPQSTARPRGFLNMTTEAEMSMEMMRNEDIKWPFIIAGLITLPAAIAFIYFFFSKPRLGDHTASISCADKEITVKSRDDNGASNIPPNRKRNDIAGNSEHDNDTTISTSDHKASRSDRQTPEEKEMTDRSPLVKNSESSRWAVRVFRVLLIVVHVPVFGLQLALGDLLTSIGLMSPLCMTAREASFFTTVLWGFSMVSRILGVVFLLRFRVSAHLLLNCLGLVVMGVVLVISSSGNVLGLWVGAAGVGLFGTSFLPGYISWSSDYLPITPLLVNLALCMAGVGELLLPFVSGQLLTAFGPGAMLLMLLMVVLLMLLLLLMAMIIGQRYLK